MESFALFPTAISTSYYSNTAVTLAPSSQPIHSLQFASQVPTTNNQQFHQMLQHHQALMVHPPQPVMYDQRRDSTSSVGGTSRRTQSKAEKRAEHNAIERARREGLNTRFQELAHLLPNLQHDTRPSKGTIIERTLEFVKDAIQKEDRYRHEIKDLRHTNRQLLKQLTHLTTGQTDDDDFLTNNDALHRQQKRKNMDQQHKGLKKKIFVDPNSLQQTESSHQLAHSTLLQPGHSPSSSSSSSPASFRSSTTLHSTASSVSVNVTNPAFPSPCPAGLHDMKPFCFDETLMKEEHLLPDLFASYHDITMQPPG